jgi:hypothetical protein
MAARPWQTAATRATNEPGPFRIHRTYYKPFDPFVRDAEEPGGDASAALKRTLDRMARYSDAADLRIAPAAAKSAMR